MIYLWYRLLYRQYFLHPEGIKNFAERCVNKYINKQALNQTNMLTAYINILKRELDKRIAELAEYEGLDRMDNGSFTIKARTSRRMKFVVYVTILFEIFLNYISTLIFIQGDGLLYVLVRWGIAIILALAAMLITDGLLTKLLPEDAVRVKGSHEWKNEDDDNYQRRLALKRQISLIILPALLVAVEIAILGVSRARAIDIEGGSGGGILYYGFILLSMALPLMAGYFKWNAEQHGKLFQNTVDYYRAQKLVHVLELIIIANKKDVKNVIELKVRQSWQLISRFRLYKENYNSKRQLPTEKIIDHYANTIDTFKSFALKQFDKEVKVIVQELDIKANVSHPLLVETA